MPDIHDSILEEPGAPTDTPDPLDYDAFAAVSQDPAARIAQDTFAKLSLETKCLWRQIDEKDHIAILSGGSEAKGKPTRSVYTGGTQPGSSLTPIGPSASQINPVDNTTEVNEASSSSTPRVQLPNEAAQAHPGDPRRVLSTKPKKATTTQANTVSFRAPTPDIAPDDRDSDEAAVTAHIDAYWASRKYAPNKLENDPGTDFPRGN